MDINDDDPYLGSCIGYHRWPHQTSRGLICTDFILIASAVLQKIKNTSNQCWIVQMFTCNPVSWYILCYNPIRVRSSGAERSEYASTCICMYQILFFSRHNNVANYLENLEKFVKVIFQAIFIYIETTTAVWSRFVAPANNVWAIQPNCASQKKTWNYVLPTEFHMTCVKWNYG